jgi:hypothetical protein
VREALFATPRPMPARRLPVLAGGALMLLALPVFAVAGLSLRGWALAAVLWVAAQGLGLLLSRIGAKGGSVAPAGVMGVGMMFRGVAVMVVAIAVAASNLEVGLSAAVLYALAYTLELALSVATYLSEEPH